LVESWPSTEIRWNERFTQVPSRSAQVCDDIAASV
jgi:hypothetical protein